MENVNLLSRKLIIVIYKTHNKHYKASEFINNFGMIHELALRHRKDKNDSLRALALETIQAIKDLKLDEKVIASTTKPIVLVPPPDQQVMIDEKNNPSRPHPSVKSERAEETPKFFNEVSERIPKTPVKLSFSMVNESWFEIESLAVNAHGSIAAELVKSIRSVSPMRPPSALKDNFYEYFEHGVVEQIFRNYTGH